MVERYSGISTRNQGGRDQAGMAVSWVAGSVGMFGSGGRTGWDGPGKSAGQQEAESGPLRAVHSRRGHLLSSWKQAEKVGRDQKGMAARRWRSRGRSRISSLGRAFRA